MDNIIRAVVMIGFIALLALVSVVGGIIQEEIRQEIEGDDE